MLRLYRNDDFLHVSVDSNDICKSLNPGTTVPVNYTTG